MRPLIVVPGSIARKNSVACDSRHIQPVSDFDKFLDQQRLSLDFCCWEVKVKSFAQSHKHVQRPASLLEWHRHFAWYPVPIPGMALRALDQE